MARARTPPELELVIVGRGRLGAGLARALGESGVPLRLSAARRPDARALGRAPLWLLAVPDPRVQALARALAPLRRGRGGRVVLHPSGSLPLDALAPLAARGAATGVVHPLVSFADRRRAPPLGGTTFVVGGAPAAVAAGRRLAAAAGARALVRPVHGPRYHALAALLANGAAALAGLATRELEALGLRPGEARRAVSALLGSVAHNVAALGMPRALTGPIARGDAEAVRRQREALGDGVAGALYVALGPAILDEAVRAGLPAAAARSVARALGPVPRGRARAGSRQSRR